MSGRISKKLKYFVLSKTGENKEQFNDLLSGNDVKGLQKYVLSKNELKAPRELSDEEKDRIAFRRKAGWSWFNPIYDLQKRDVIQHIQNPLYRAAFDTAGSGIVGSAWGAIYGHQIDKLMHGLGGPKPRFLTMGKVLPMLAALPALISARHNYERQKLYNDIAEEHVKHHTEGGIDTMSNVIRDMSEKAKNVSSLTMPKRKVKQADDKSFGSSLPQPENELKAATKNLEGVLKHLPSQEKIQSFHRKMNAFQGLGTIYSLYKAKQEYDRNRTEIDDLRERFHRKLKNKADAEVFLTKVRMPLYRKGLDTDDKIQKFEEMFKNSAEKPENSPMLPHQQRIVEKLKASDQPGLILMHGLGSGKTRSSIEAYKSLGLPAEVLLPAALKGNYEKEIKKWVGKTPKDIHITSQQEVGRKGIDPERLKDKLMIIDEAHRLRNEDTQLYKNLKNVSPKKRVLLTGTPIYNDPSDIAKLINIASGKNILPERKPEFEKEYISQKTVFPSFIHRLLGASPGQELGVKNKEYLRAVFHKMIDYHAGNAEGFPTVDKETIKVPMAEKQQQIYKALMKDLPWHLRLKVSAGLPPDRKELDKLIPFLSGARMISNTTQGFEKDPANVASPKIQKAFEFLKSKMDEDPSYKGLIYSNYLQSGVEPYKKLLQEAHIPYGEFTGDINDKVRNQLVKDYNANKLRALIVSSAGGEGLDLKGTRLVQLLEPHFNNEKIKQVIGRAARYKSHEGLDPEKQKVLIQNYLSSLNPSLMDKVFRKQPVSTDEYLQNISDEKEKLNNEFIKLIRE